MKKVRGVLRYSVFSLAVALTIAGFVLGYLGVLGYWLFLVAFSMTLFGIRDLLQTRHSLLRNYPLVGWCRYLIEAIRPQIRQYLLETDIGGMPFNREQRSVVYRRAKEVEDKQPFGTELDVYRDGYEWINHSVAPSRVNPETLRVPIGNRQCRQPYSASVFNISALSFGALGMNAIRALNKGAKLGGFAHDTGEGGISVYHREFEGDLIWEIGSGYFGCRREDGGFDPDRFAMQARSGQVKMIEVKLSQGAKPGHGGILPAAKVSREIAETRHVRMGEDCVSPARHSAFSTPLEFVRFLATLRELSGGKPVGFKLCVGHPWELMGICKAILETDIIPDFIVIDGKEGGTGAAPYEFSNGLGTPLREGLIFVHNALVGAALRDKIKIIASGKIITGLDMALKLAIGADLCNAARGMMFALGCIQARRCHADTCPTGIATHDPWRVNGLVVGDKAPRVAHYHHNTVHHFLKVLAAAGLQQASELHPALVLRRVAPTTVRSYAELYDWLTPGALLNGNAPPRWQQAWEGKTIAAPELIAAT